MKILALLLLFAFAETSIQDEFSKTSEKIFPSVLTEHEAAQLFLDFQSKDHIPFNYPLGGCDARATEMARIAEKKQINMAKIFVEGSLRVRSPDKRYDPVEWDWHVAPVAVVQVKDQEVMMVFDPSLFEKPVLVDEWLQIMQAEVPGKKSPEIKEYYYARKFQYRPKRFEKQKLSWRKKDLEKTRAALKEFAVFNEARSSYDQDTGPGDAFDKELRLLKKEKQLLKKRNGTR